MRDSFLMDLSRAKIVRDPTAVTRNMNGAELAQVPRARMRAAISVLLT